ncbi:Protein of unknown function UPF0191 [gamma proteobacterium HdN1]|nr:Protein of unknown function UPF0191 [gamma proteobacterium HdN1]
MATTLTALLNRYEARLRIALFFISLLPALDLLWRLQQNNLGINPFQTLSHRLGHSALIFLLLTLAITPLRRWLRYLCARLQLRDGKRLADWNFLIRCRRQLGLYGFFYASLHLLIYLHFEVQWEWEYWQEEINEKPYLMLGLTAWILTLLLAITSPKIVIRYMRHWWRRLHRLNYLLVPVAVAHHYLAAKTGNDWPLLAAVAAAILLLHRVWVRLSERFYRSDDGMAATRRTLFPPPKSAPPKSASPLE